MTGDQGRGRERQTGADRVVIRIVPLVGDQTVRILDLLEFVFNPNIRFRRKGDFRQPPEPRQVVLQPVLGRLVIPVTGKTAVSLKPEFAPILSAEPKCGVNLALGPLGTGASRTLLLTR